MKGFRNKLAFRTMADSAARTIREINAAGRRFPAAVLSRLPRRKRYAAVALLLILALLAALAAFHLSLKHQIARDTVHRLESVAHFNAGHIQSRLDDARSAIRLTAHARPFLDGLDTWLRGERRDRALGERLNARLKEFVAAGGFDDMSLYDANGALLMTTAASGRPKPHGATPAAIATAMAAADDFQVADHRESGDIGLFSAVRSPASGTPIATLYVALNPDRLFPPMLRQWPADSSAETVLFRRDGADAVFFGPSRRDGPSQYLLLSSPDQLAAKALAGQQGVLNGTDYRGRRCLAYAVPIPGTQWQLLSKIDEDEVYSQLRQLTLVIVALAGMQMAAGFWWWRSKRPDAPSPEGVSPEEQRRNLSALLHDRTSPNLAAMEVNLKVLTRLVPQGTLPAQAEAVLADIRVLLKDTAAAIRSICTELRPPLIHYAGLLPELERYAKTFSRRTGIEVTIDSAIRSTGLDAEKETLLFRIVQEAMTNTLKHARADAIRIILKRDRHGSISIVIHDDGIGFGLDHVGKDGHPLGHGLLNMKTISQSLGGRFKIMSSDGKGTTISIRLAPTASARALLPPAEHHPHQHHQDQQHT